MKDKTPDTKQIKNQIKNFCEVVAPKLPAASLKGKNHDTRIRLSYIIPASRDVAEIFAMIPPSHAQIVCIARRGGYSGGVKFVSYAVANFIKLCYRRSL